LSLGNALVVLDGAEDGASDSATVGFSLNNELGFCDGNVDGAFDSMALGSLENALGV